MSVSQGYKYLLVMIDTLTGQIEVFPTLIEKAWGSVFTVSSAFLVQVRKPSIHPVNVSAP